MKKINRIRGLIGILIIIGVIGIGRLGINYMDQQQRKQILNTPLVPLTEEEKVEDFEYLYKTIIENYPYLGVNERMNGIDWAGKKEEYLQKIRDTQREGEFYFALNDILRELGNGHTHMMNYTFIVSLRDTYSRLKEEGWWQGINFDIINHPLVLRRYGIPDEMKQEEEQAKGEEISNRPQIENAVVEDVVAGKIGYIGIPQMLSPWLMDRDKEIIGTYLQQIAEYQALIIDIRGNGGGDTRYWSDYLVPQIIDKSYSTQVYSFFKDGELVNRYFEASQLNKKKLGQVAELSDETLPMLPSEVYEDFSYYTESTSKVNSAPDSIKFEGKIYLLVDEGVYSSAEGLAMFAKESGLATLIGEATGGDGIGSDPLLAMLPNSGYVFRFTKEMGTTGDGTCNEEHKTMPDYEVENPSKNSDFSKDDCIQKVLELEGLDL